MTRGIPEYGDILFTTEAPLGNVAQLLTRERLAFAQRVITLHPVCTFDPAYLVVALMSPLVQKSIQAQATGTTARGIKAAKLKLIPFPMPPKDEQTAIVLVVEKIMKLCDDLEAKLLARDEKAARLAAALVAEAIA